MAVIFVNKDPNEPEPRKSEEPEGTEPGTVIDERDAPPIQGEPKIRKAK